MYQLHLLDAAIDDLAKLDKSIARRIITRLRWLAEHLENHRLERLTGELLGFYKFRVGDYRILYQKLLEYGIYSVLGGTNSVLQRNQFRTPKPQLYVVKLFYEEKYHDAI